jgi:hypothetical protein
MSKVFCLLNHTLTDLQNVELESKFSATQIIYPPAQLQSAWSEIPTVDELNPYIFKPFISWLLSNAHAEDYLVIQGEFGATVCMVEFSFSKGLIPLHSVTKRVAKEHKVGEKVYRNYLFQHICFRKYVSYSKLLENYDGDDLHCF